MTFWTSERPANEVSLRINDDSQVRLKKSTPIETPPSCGDITEWTYYVKPGRYSYRSEYEQGRNFILFYPIPR